MKTAKGLGVFGLLLGAALVLSTYIVSDTIRDVRMSHQIIKVRGYAETPVTSDLANWEITVKARAPKVADAYAILAQHRKKVRAFLEERGMTASEIGLEQVSISEEKAKDFEGNETNEIEYYKLSQEVYVVTSDVNKVSKASQAVVALVGEGVELHAGSPRYYYTGVNELKSKLLIEATKDARARAQVLAEGSGVSLGPLRAARQGVFSVRSASSSSVSESSYEDVNHIKKKVTAIVTVDYAMK